MKEVKESQKTDQATPEKGLAKVENIAQAVHVLVQAVEIGRQKGIYDWNDATLIGQALSVISASSQGPQGPQVPVQSKEDEPVISEE